MKILFKIFVTIILLLAATSCQNPKIQQSDAYQGLNDSIKNAFAPDKRVAIYEVEIASEGTELVIKGETDQPEAIRTLIDRLNKEDVKVDNQVIILPDSTVGNFTHAVVNNSVANIRTVAKHSGELATQAILGISLKVLKIDGDFYLVQTPDGYISWVDHGGVTLMNEEEFKNWQHSQKVVYTKPFGHVYEYMSDELYKIGDIVLGAQLKLIEDSGDFYKVSYPDKRIGYLKKSDSEFYGNWVNKLNPSGTLIELYAKELMGAPYLWGGTSSKGMDCSGFTKTVYLMNGFIIPRDASQQINAGKDIDPQLELKNLQKGDLMFFGKKATDSTRQRVTHVGIWLGNDRGEFIHASGRVRIGSIDKNSSHYDEFNTNRYLGSRRYLGEKDDLIINLKNIDSKIKS